MSLLASVRQGMSFMAALLLTQFEEEAAFWMMTIMFLKYGLYHLYDERFVGFTSMCDSVMMCLPWKVSLASECACPPASPHLVPPWDTGRKDHSPRGPATEQSSPPP